MASADDDHTVPSETPLHMAESEEITLLVSFVRDEKNMSLGDLKKRLVPVDDFFLRHSGDLGILGKPSASEIRVYRSHGRGAHATKDHGEGLLYEAPFAEAKYNVRIRTTYSKDNKKRSPYAYVYTRWCEAPPDLDAWLSRGPDQYLIDGVEKTKLRDEFRLANLSFGVIINLTDFYPEGIIQCAEESTTGTRSWMEAKAHFHHAYKYLKIFLTMHHTCEEYGGAPSEYLLEIEYSSIARAIVDIRREETHLYLRLTHPVILYGSALSNQSSINDQRQRNNFKNYDRINVLTQPHGSGACHSRIKARLLGGSNTLRLGWKNARGLLLTLHSILAKLPRSESVIASMTTHEKPKEGIKQANAIIDRFLNDDSITFRAKYAIEACKLISLDLYRQMAILPREEVESFFDNLRKLAVYEGNHKLLEKTMFNLLKAVDEGNVVMYKEAVPSQFKKFETQEREKRRRTNVDKEQELKEEKPVQGMAIVYKVFLTPSRSILRPPEEHGENRILRQVDRDFMLRVAFRDDHLRSLTHSLREERGQLFLESTIKKFLTDGVALGGRTYEYLAASSSQLRDHGCWFYAKDSEGRTSASIREEMGSFDNIRNVGKKMAREGLCFSSTIETVKVSQEECSREPDIKGGAHEKSGKPYTFSDGIGKISKTLRDDVCKALADTLKEKKPSAFQIRYQGAKGMVAVDPSLEGRRLILRDSMVKFDCPSSASASFEVIKYSEERSTTLNRQVITILEQLGVDPNVFIRYQEANIVDFADALIFENIASERLTASVKKDSDCLIEYSKFREFGMSIIRDPYFRAMLIVLYKNIITNLRSKARIAIPWGLGRNLLGVMDETGKLDYGQVYIRYTTREDPSGPEKPLNEGEGVEDSLESLEDEPETKVVEGPVVVTKCPCVHPGDVRMLQAVDVPELAHLVDVIVFPQKGERPHPNEMAGSDLDGDEYAVLWDDSFFFECKCPECKERRLVAKSPNDILDRNHKPMTFDDGPEETQENITLSDYFDFICKFIMTDNKGNISNAHLARADSEEQGIFSPTCIKLAEKISICLDFAKTGRPTKLDRSEIPKKYPDFMEKQDHKPSYCSQKVLGTLYRTCRALENTASMNSIEADERYFNELFCLNGWERMKTKAIEFVRLYERLLTKIMQGMGIQSEAEIMVSVVNQVGKYMSNSFHEMEELQEVLERQRAYLNKQMKKKFEEMTGKNKDNELYLASACYMIVYNPPDGEKYTHFYGAPWILFEQLTDCRKLNDDITMEIPNCPLAERITKAINDDETIDIEEKETMKAMMKIVDWAKAEGLSGAKKGITCCNRCLHDIFEQSQQAEMEIDPSAGASVLLFIRYCALDFSRKAESLQFSKCVEKCSMHKKDTAMLHRMTTTAIGTYSALAVSGDVCAIKGLLCGRNHSRHVSWSAKLCSPLVLDVRGVRNIDFFDNHKRDIEEILKRWCDAEPDDRIEFDFKDSKGIDRVGVIVEAREWTRHKLEERLYSSEEKILIDELKDELKSMGKFKKTKPRVHQNLRP